MHPVWEEKHKKRSPSGTLKDKPKRGVEKEISKLYCQEDRSAKAQNVQERVSNVTKLNRSPAGGCRGDADPGAL